MSERGWKAWDGFAVGDKVVTRRGKTGTVVEVLDSGDILVAFGFPKPIQLRATQVVSEAAYRKMQAGSAVNASNQRYNQR